MEKTGRPGLPKRPTRRFTSPSALSTTSTCSSVTTSSNTFSAEDEISFAQALQLFPSRNSGGADTFSPSGESEYSHFSAPHKEVSRTKGPCMSTSASIQRQAESTTPSRPTHPTAQKRGLTITIPRLLFSLPSFSLTGPSTSPSTWGSPLPSAPPSAFPLSSPTHSRLNFSLSPNSAPCSPVSSRRASVQSSQSGSILKKWDPEAGAFKVVPCAYPRSHSPNREAFVLGESRKVEALCGGNGKGGGHTDRRLKGTGRAAEEYVKREGIDLVQVLRNGADDEDMSGTVGAEESDATVIKSGAPPHTKKFATRHNNATWVPNLSTLRLPAPHHSTATDFSSPTTDHTVVAISHTRSLSSMISKPRRLTPKSSHSSLTVAYRWDSREGRKSRLGNLDSSTMRMSLGRKADASQNHGTRRETRGRHRSESVEPMPLESGQSDETPLRNVKSYGNLVDEEEGTLKVYYWPEENVEVVMPISMIASTGCERTSFVENEATELCRASIRSQDIADADAYLDIAAAQSLVDEEPEPEVQVIEDAELDVTASVDLSSTSTVPWELEEDYEIDIAIKKNNLAGARTRKLLGMFGEDAKEVIRTKCEAEGWAA